MWRKNTNPKPGFKGGLNPGFGFAKIQGFPGSGFFETWLESLLERLKTEMTLMRTSGPTHSLTHSVA